MHLVDQAKRRASVVGVAAINKEKPWEGKRLPVKRKRDSIMR